MRWKRQSLVKYTSAVLAFTIILLNLFPIVTLAGFIKPGTPISPGSPIQPGDAIPEGKMIVPGDVQKNGQPSTNGKSITSGKPIIEGESNREGGFIVPNAPYPAAIPSNSSVSDIGGTPLQGGQDTNGSAVNPGKGNSSGQGPNGNASNPGEGLSGGQTSNGSTNASGKEQNNGQIANNGSPINSGNELRNSTTTQGEGTDGNRTSEGEAINPQGQGLDGDNPNAANNLGIPTPNGSITNSAQETVRGQDSNSSPNQNPNSLAGERTNGNEIRQGNPSKTQSSLKNNSSNTDSKLNVSGTSNTSSEDQGSNSFLAAMFASGGEHESTADKSVAVVKDVRRYVTNFGDDMAQAAAAKAAGFKFDYKGNNWYSIKGKQQLDNKVSNWFYNRYRSYSQGGHTKSFGPYSRRVKLNGKYNAFMSSKNLGKSSATKLQLAKAGAKDSLSKNYNPKTAFRLSNISKLNGAVTVGLSSWNSISEYNSNADKEFASTNFAADLTTDVAIGVGTTAASGAVSAMVAGAVAGSTIPVAGTIAGAAAGLALSIGASLFLNSRIGRKLKNGLSNTIKKGYDGIVNAGKKAVSAVKNGLSGLFGT
ncbi:hypothetical protein GLW08_20630 [Pontibacillus yanchengensis]|uniref:Uncharacterized protein n=1 Tax=Pontibacillus yanchengensis TaxID=462910 RepID=A0ACC7VMF8_9BACI|nr:hypothetical protein [Pontibacillus yanchengensis]MYL55711.1 hypothetical protein [Pontibacillus yanchengensis]